MKETIEKPDGRIEFQSSPCCCPPDSQKPRGSIHTRAFTWWMRTLLVVEEHPQQGAWTNCLDLANCQFLKALAEECKTVNEFLGHEYHSMKP